MYDPTAKIRHLAKEHLTTAAASLGGMDSLAPHAQLSTLAGLESLAPHAQLFRAAERKLSTLGAASVPLPPQGKTTDDPGGAWAQYLTAMADQLELANAEMLGNYDMMRDVLSGLDVPLLQTVADPSGMGFPTAWTADHDQQFVNAHAMAQAAVGWLRETAAGERVLMIQGDRWMIEQKPTDDFSIQIDPKTRLPVMVAPAPAGVEGYGDGTLGGAPILAPLLALHPIILGIGIIAVAAVAGGILYVLYRLVSGIITIIQGIVDYQSTKKQYECLDNHTAEECIATQKGIVDLTKTINEGREKPSDDPVGNAAKGVGGLLATGLWVALGGALIYLGIKTIPPLLDEMKAKQKLKAQTA